MVKFEDEKPQEEIQDFYIVYQITNMINCKIYIGIHHTKNLNDGYMGSGKLIRLAIRKYGIENFKKEILFLLEDYKSLYLKERELVNEEFVKRKDTYNIMTGGCGCDLDSNETKKLLSSKRKGRIPWNKGIKTGIIPKNKGTHPSSELREKMCIAQAKRVKDYPVTEEMRAKLKESRKGKKPRLGTHHSEETKKKISESLKLIKKKNKKGGSSEN